MQCKAQGIQKQPGIKEIPLIMFAPESDVITGAKSLIFSVLLNILNNTLAMLSPV